MRDIEKRKNNKVYKERQGETVTDKEKQGGEVQGETVTESKSQTVTVTGES